MKKNAGGSDDMYLNYISSMLNKYCSLCIEQAMEVNLFLIFNFQMTALEGTSKGMV